MFSFTPLPERLPPVTWLPVIYSRSKLRIGGVVHNCYVYCSRVAGTLYVEQRKLRASQAGEIILAARAVNTADGGVEYVQPSDFVAIKREPKTEVQRQQERLGHGHDGDNSLLDKSLLLMLNSLTPASARVRLGGPGEGGCVGWQQGWRWWQSGCGVAVVMVVVVVVVV